MITIESIINNNIVNGNEDAFFVFNVEDIIEKHKKWKKLLPRVTPYYAVKCNNMQLLLQILAELDLCFDCSSQAEVESVMSCGVESDRIIFANACKSPSFIKYVKSVGVDLMTFDNEEELVKISRIYPKARLLLRIKADDSHSTSKLGLKFGADVNNFEQLLQRAKSLNLDVVGIAFHVGSGCQSTQPYRDAIEKSRQAFDIAIELGFTMNLLDIGGGFPGSDNSVLKFEQIVSVVNNELENYFPINGSNLTIIAEPGRYYAMSAFCLLTFITSKRVDIINNQKIIMYYINDGLYGSFGSVATGNKIVKPIPIFIDNKHTELRENCLSVIWGPTCDSWDCVRKHFQMIEMNVSEWLMFEHMGSYSISPSSNFNGMPLPKIKIFVSESAKQVLSRVKNWDNIQQLLRDYI